MVRTDTSQSNSKTIHLKDRATVDIYNKLRAEGVNISELFSFYLHEINRKRNERSRHHPTTTVVLSPLANCPVGSNSNNNTTVNNGQAAETGELGSDELSHQKHLGIGVSLLSTEKQMDYFINLGRFCPDCMREYHRLKDKVDQEQMRKEAQQLKQKQKQEQLLEQEPEENKEEEEIEEEIIDVPTITTTS